MRKWFLVITISAIAGSYTLTGDDLQEDARFLIYTTYLQTADFRLYWKDPEGKPYQSLGNLNAQLSKKKKTLLFAANAGMYRPDNSPQGLFIEEGKILAPLDTFNGKGNFYIKPNGIFYVDSLQHPYICTTEDFTYHTGIRYATQSGPVLVTNRKIHPAFNPRSANLNIRNGVGILPDERVVFIMSTEPVNFYDFAIAFRKTGCKEALYLDGFVSRTYLPEKQWIQTDGNFGVIIGITEK